MNEGSNERDRFKKPAKTKVQRLAEKIARANTGANVSPVKISVTLMGPAAAAWKGIVDAKGDLSLDDAGVMGLLLEAGSSTVRQALSAAARG